MQYAKLVRFLYKNHHDQRKFRYLVNRNSDEPAKIGHSQFVGSTFEVKNQHNLPGNDFPI